MTCWRCVLGAGFPAMGLAAACASTGRGFASRNTENPAHGRPVIYSLHTKFVLCANVRCPPENCFDKNV